jgi:hypothetical protein
VRGALERPCDPTAAGESCSACSRGSPCARAGSSGRARAHRGRGRRHRPSPHVQSSDLRAATRRKDAEAHDAPAARVAHRRRAGDEGMRSREKMHKHTPGDCLSLRREALCRCCAADFLGGSTTWFDEGPRGELPSISYPREMHLVAHRPSRMAARAPRGTAVLGDAHPSVCRNDGSEIATRSPRADSLFAAS